MLRGRTIQKRNTKRIFSAPWNLRTNRTMVRKIMIKLMHLRLLCGWAQSFFILWQVNSSVTRRKQYYLQRFSTEKIFPCENTKIFPDQQDWNVRFKCIHRAFISILNLPKLFASTYPPNIFERGQRFKRPWGLS